MPLRKEEWTELEEEFEKELESYIQECKASLEDALQKGCTFRENLTLKQPDAADASRVPETPVAWAAAGL